MFTHHLSFFKTRLIWLVLILFFLWYPSNITASSLATSTNPNGYKSYYIHPVTKNPHYFFATYFSRYMGPQGVTAHANYSVFYEWEACADPALGKHGSATLIYTLKDKIAVWMGSTNRGANCPYTEYGKMAAKAGAKAFLWGSHRWYDKDDSIKSRQNVEVGLECNFRESYEPLDGVNIPMFIVNSLCLEDILFYFGKNPTAQIEMHLSPEENKYQIAFNICSYLQWYIFCPWLLMNNIFCIICFFKSYSINKGCVLNGPIITLLILFIHDFFRFIVTCIDPPQYMQGVVIWTVVIWMNLGPMPLIYIATILISLIWEEFIMTINIMNQPTAPISPSPPNITQTSQMSEVPPPIYPSINNNSNTSDSYHKPPTGFLKKYRYILFIVFLTFFLIQWYPLLFPRTSIEGDNDIFSWIRIAFNLIIFFYFLFTGLRMFFTLKYLLNQSERTNKENILLEIILRNVSICIVASGLFFFLMCLSIGLKISPYGHTAFTVSFEEMLLNMSVIALSSCYIFVLFSTLKRANIKNPNDLELEEPDQPLVVEDTVLNAL